MQTRPLRELVNSKALRPTDKGSVMRERRQSDRFMFRMPGVLETNGREFPVECLEISKGGVRIHSLRPLSLNAGQHVTVRTRIGAQVFEDAFTVARTSRIAQGTTCIHLRLEANKPARSGV